MRSGVELWIGGVLCDVAEDFSVRIDRQLLNPSELAAKDAQYSYAVSLPATAANNAALRHANVEEVRGRFSRWFPASLTVRGVQVFEGRFLLSGATAEGYRGNLYRPKARTAKDVFGERTMGEAGEWPLPFGAFAASVSMYNRKAAEGVQDAIFPYALYGLLPKVADASGQYTARTVWDDTVRLGVGDIMPSINVLRAVRHLFEGAGLRIGGSAFDDDRLSRLYMSYHNSADHAPAWNWGLLGRMSVRGRWCNVLDTQGAADVLHADAGIYRTTGAVGEEYAWDLCNSTNSTLEIIEDPGGNVLRTDHTDEGGRAWRGLQIRIPAAGYYKVTFRGGVRLLEDVPFNPLRPPLVDGVMYASATMGELSNGLTDRGDIAIAAELHLLRDHARGDFGMSKAHTDGVFYRKNLNQSAIFGDPGESPKFFPKVGASTQVVMVDRAEDEHHTLGLGWGVTGPGEGEVSPHRNPLDTIGAFAQVQAAKPALSWDSSYNTDEEDRTLLAIQSPGYAKYYVSGTDDAGDPVFAWEGETDKYRIELTGAPTNYARRGMYEGVSGADDGARTGEGLVHAVVWLEAGELLTVAATTVQGFVRMPHWKHRRGACIAQEAYFELHLEPYQTSREWLTVDPAGTGTAPMAWDGASTFRADSIDLATFLPTEVRADEWLDNLCKAFNLRLTQTGDGSFSLDAHLGQVRDFPRVVDLDALASMRERKNTPLGLPSRFEIGFTIDAEEEGYAATGETGGGTFETGAPEGKTVEQRSTFSYNWFKALQKTGPADPVTIEVPVISAAEVWSDYGDYAEDMAERYTDSAQRFWYYSGLLPDAGAPYNFGGDPLEIAAVSGTLPGLSVLDYRDRPLSIMRNFFALPIDAGSHYTEVSVYLPPSLYAQIGPATGARFNGDLYYVAEVGKYDPTGREKTTLKLIRRI